MAIKIVSPLSRQALQELTVAADAYSARRYLQHRQVMPRLPEIEIAGEKTMPGSAGILADLYHVLWDDEPVVKPADAVRTDRRYWQQLLAQTIKSSAFQELHGMTQMQDLMAALGAVSMGETVMGLVPEADREKLQQMQQTQSEAGELEQEAQQAEAEAQVAEQMAQEAAQAAQGMPSQGEGEGKGGQSGNVGGMTSEHAQRLADQLAKAAAQARAEAQAAQELADEANEKLEQLSNELLGAQGTAEASAKERELARLGMAAVKKATAQAKELSDIIQSWGLEPGELTEQSMTDVNDVLAELRRNPRLKEFHNFMGAMRRIAARKAKTLGEGEGHTTIKVEYGRDISRASRDDLVALVHPATRNQTLLRWAQSEIKLIKRETLQTQGEGDVHMLEDASGSMDGVKQMQAKALTLAMAEFAKLRKRGFTWSMFDTYVRKERAYPNGQLSARQMLEIAQSRAGGGTDFEAPLRSAMKLAEKNGKKKATIVLLTDGMCAVSAAFVKEFKAFKAKFQVELITILVDVGEATNQVVMEISDHVVKLSELTVTNAESRVFSLFK